MLALLLGPAAAPIEAPEEWKKPATVATDTDSVTLVSFDAHGASEHKWAAVNDPVMGGQSFSTISVDTTAEKAVWEGQVKIVPFLKAPGFCNAQTPGLYETSSFPDASGFDGLQMRARTNGTGLTHFNAMLMTKGAKKWNGQQGVYNANYTLSGEWEDLFVSWDQFSCTRRGEPAKWCPELSTELAQITSLGVGTAFPGSAGPFHVEIASIKASKRPAVGVVEASHVKEEAPEDCTTYRKVTDGECADDCLLSKIGICPVSLVVKTGGLEAGACKDISFTQADGTMDEQAGPCGKLTFNKWKKPVTVVAA